VRCAKLAYKQARERNKRLKKLAKDTDHAYGAGAWYNENKGRYIKYQVGSQKFRKYLRRQSSKKARQYKGDLAHSDYKKTFDYWWTLLLFIFLII
jgi:hypothetical protein